MSVWSYISGVVRVMPVGRTQPEKEYVLKTTLNHLPIVAGSEEPMYVMVNQIPGVSSSSTVDEFFNRSNLAPFTAPYGMRNDGMFETQDFYIVTVDGCLRDVTYQEAVRMFMRWITRLAKRIHIDSILVGINSPHEGGGSMIFENDYYCSSLYDADSDRSWADYLMWDYRRDKEGNLISGKPEVH